MSEKEVQKKVYDRNEIAANLRGYADGQALTDDEVRIALRAIDWINASAKNSQAKLSEHSGVSVARLSPFFAGKYTGDTHGIVKEVGNFLVRLETEGEIAAIPFIETSMWERVKVVIDNARFDKQPGMLFGESQMGKTACLARRKGDAWYLVAIGDWSARTLELSTKFLGSGEWNADAFEDAADADKDGTHYVHEKKSVAAGEKIKFHLAPGGGFVVRFSK